MSVKQWKRVITLTVLFTIILLLVLAVMFCTKSCHYRNMINGGKLISLDEYGKATIEGAGLNDTKYLYEFDTELYNIVAKACQ